MPKNPLGKLPFPPLQVLDQDEPIQAVQIRRLLLEKSNVVNSNLQLKRVTERSSVEAKVSINGISLLLRSECGHDNRGGYYFHFKRKPSSEEFDLYDFHGENVASMNEDDLVLLINHCSGREFSPRSYEVCQNKINLRDDSK